MSEPLNLERLSSELDHKRMELARCYSVLNAMIETYDNAAATASKSDHLLGIQEKDIEFLWGEIRKLQEGVKAQAVARELAEKQVNALKEHIAVLRELAKQNGVSLDELPMPNLSKASAHKVNQLNPADEQSSSGKVEKHFYCGLDTPASGLRFDADEMIHLGGWCVDGQGAPAKRVWVAVRNREIPCTMGWKREDVVKSFKSQMRVAQNCGFEAEIEADAGANFLRVWAEFASGARHCIMHRTVVKLAKHHYRMGQLDQNYSTWVEFFDTLDDEQIAAMRERIQRMENPPLISVLLPTYNTEERWLSEAIESVRKQIYPHWQLCIADDASPKPHVRQILDYYSNLDSRIVHVIRDTNGHISAATNSALGIAEGSYCALLDHDDVLPRDALFHVAEMIDKDPDTDLIYSDEDKIDEKGQRFDPYFKSDWNPELFQSHNCISHLGVYRTSILKAINGFQEDLFGSQDWDMALRFISKAGESGIRHIPKVLYHWRYLDSSTSKSIESKPYAVLAGRRALENYLKVSNEAAIVTEGTWSGSFRVKPLLKHATTVSIVILEKDVERVERCIQSIMSRTEYSLFEIIVVTDCSALTKESGAKREFSRRAIYRVGGLDSDNEARSLNIGAARAAGDVMVFLSQNVEVSDEEWLTELTAQVMKPDVAVAGAWQQYPDASTHCAALVLKDNCSGVLKAFRGLPETDIGHMGRAHLIQRFSAVANECFAVKRGIFENLGGFSESKLNNVFWNVDFCLRARFDAGKYSVWSPYAKVCIHEEFFSESASNLSKELAELESVWGTIVPRDPYFNMNLDENDPRFFLSWPPRPALSN